MKDIEVVAAVIVFNNKILCVQKDKNKYDYISYKYEFPGGKVEPRETREEAIIREIKEELELDISIQQEFLTVEHEYPDFNITLYSFICSCEHSALKLTEHIHFNWFNTDQLSALDWAGADRLVVEKIIYEGV